MDQGSGRTLVDHDVASRHGFKVVAFFVSFGGIIYNIVYHVVFYTSML